MDIVSPLPPSNGYRYLRTCIDRFTRWLEATPIADITAPTIPSAFVHTWIACFGVSSTITTDRDSQFESALFRKHTQLLGTDHVRTTAYHPAANGMVERFHRQLVFPESTCQVILMQHHSRPFPRPVVRCLSSGVMGQMASFCVKFPCYLSTSEINIFF